MSPFFFCSTAFGVALFLSLSLTPLIRSLSIRRGFVAQPKEDRWHKKPTALHGGVGIFLSFSLSWLGTLLFSETDRSFAELTPLLLCSSAIFVLGFVDDIREIRPQHKLVGQIIISSILVLFGFQIQWFDSRALNLIVSIFWIVGITNAFNLLDNMDGLSAGIAFLAGFFLFALSWDSPSVPAAAMLAVFLGSVLGFLFFNFPPATIFMGDSGSLFLGFFLAGISTQAPGLITISYSGQIAFLLLIPILILFIPIADTTFVTIMRKLSGRPASRGGRDHLSHRIVAIGFSEKSAVLILYGFATVSGMIALGVKMLSPGIHVAVILAFLLFSFFFWIHLAKVKIYEEASVLDDSRLTPLLFNITYKKRIFEVLLDLLLIPLAYWIAYLLRFEGAAYDENIHVFLQSLPVVVICQLSSFYFFGVYHGIWQYVGMRDVLRYIKAISVGVILALLIHLLVYRFIGFSRSLFFIYWMMLIFFVTASRFSWRFLAEVTPKNRKATGRKTLIYGAGAAGTLVVKEIEQNSSLGLEIVGFIDDDIRKQQSHFLGYPVLGGLEGIEEIIEQFDVSEVVVSYRSMDKASWGALKRTCDFKHVQLSRLRISID
jgi:UDP-GlcNAc:undecaprenyl-phosphate/decaprenyl-phosphate GlcNAc-1-phosphate transferase